MLELLDAPPVGRNFLPLAFLDVAFLLAIVSAIVAQIVRYRTHSTPAERQQTKWVVFGIILALVGLLVSFLVFGLVTAILAGVLAVSSDLAKRIFLALTSGSSELEPILATLIVVAAFDPIRKRVQALDGSPGRACDRGGTTCATCSSPCTVINPPIIAVRFVLSPMELKTRTTIRD